tara:strand:+ start:216 stop:1295 length:1080 start_codon:yes stop_codon:yes gene_type:complete
MAPLKSFSELAFKKDKNLPNLKVPVKGKKGVSKYMRKAGITSKKPYDSEFRQRMVASVQSADRKPEKYIKPDGKVGIRMVKTDKEVIKKEAVEYPHMMYDPKTGNEVKAKTPADHNKYAKMGYTHEKPKVDEASMSPMNLKRAEKFMGPSKNFNQAVNLVSKGMKVSKQQAIKMVKKILGVNPKTNKIDEAIKHTHAVVDPAGKVAGMTSNERDAKDIARRHKGRVIKLKKPMSPNKGDMMINRPFKEEVEVDEALTLQQRMKRSRLMKRLKTRIKIGRERARRKMANKQKLEKRAMRQARAQIAKKLTRGIPKGELSFARKQEIEKRLEKPAFKQRIKRIAKRIFKDVRKKEVQRKKG